jgi:hypothetical protein
VPVIDAVTVSVPASFGSPAIASVAENVPVRLSVEFAGERQAVAAGEVHRSAVARGNDVRRIERRDREAEGASAVADAGALTEKCVAGPLEATLIGPLRR